MLTLQDVQSSGGIKRVIGTCPTTADATDLINEAGRRLMRRGDWFETFVPIFVCVYNGCVVMPRYVQQVRRINFCNQALPVHNAWWDMIAYNQTYGTCGTWGAWYSRNCGQKTGLKDPTQTAVFQDVQGPGRLIRAYARCSADYGKTMTIFGTDNNGQALITFNPSTGAVTDGQLITLGPPFGSTNTFVSSISYVVRDPTLCPVDVYAYNATSNLLEDIAHYQPGETTPTYTKYKLDVPWPFGCVGSMTSPNCCAALRGVTMLVKLRWIDAVYPNDLILVPCVDALKLMIMAIIREDAQDQQGARAFEKDAIEILNRELENNSPDEQFTVGVNTLGPNVWSNQCF